MNTLECIVQKSKLLTFVSVVEKVSGKNLTLASLNGVYVETQKNNILLRATNLDVGIEVTIPAKIEKEGFATIPGTVLSQVLSNSFKGDHITIKGKEGTLTIESDDGVSTVKTLPEEEFPSIPHISDGKKIIVKAKDFITGISDVWYSASQSTIKPELASVYVYPEGKDILFVATDSFRLAEKRVSAQTTGDFDYFLIPARNIPEILRVLELAENEIELVFNENQLSFEFDSVHFTTRLTDGSFPDYKQIIPQNFTTEVTLLVKDLQQACKRTTVFSDRFHQVQFIIQPLKKLLRVISKNPDIGESVTDIDAVFEGEQLEISFNLRYLTDVFQSLASDSVVLQFSGVGKPLIIRGVSNSSFLYLVMPMNK